MRRLILVVALVGLFASACSSSSDTGTPPDTGLPDNPDRCEPAPQQVLDYLSTGLVIEDLTMPWGFAVKSTDYPDVWIVSTGVEGPNDSDIATFAIRAGTWPTDYIGTVAVGEFSQTITNWGEGVDIIVTPATDGVMSAEACAIARLETGA